MTDLAFYAIVCGTVALLLLFVFCAMIVVPMDDAADEIARQLANGEAPSPTNFHNLHDAIPSPKGQ